MSITLFILLGLLFTLHFIGDFMLQTHKQAINKSTSIKYLTYHVLTYCIPFLVFLTGGLSLNMLWFFLLLFGTHWVTDFVTSKITSYFWQKKDMHNFFVIIGFDQLIHILTLMYLLDTFIL
jgi:hypothetical protein